MKHIVAILVRPGAAWAAIARERMTAAGLLATILPLCLLPAIATVVGMSAFGSDWDPLHGYRAGGTGLMGIGAANFLFPAITILLLASILHWLAVPDGKTRPRFIEAFKVAAFGAVPLLLSGALLILPVMVIATMVAGMHSLFLLHQGMQKVLGVRSEDATMMLGMCVILLSVTAGALGALASAVGLI